jgi:hypothetical protein
VHAGRITATFQFEVRAKSVADRSSFTCPSFAQLLNFVLLCPLTSARRDTGRLIAFGTHVKQDPAAQPVAKSKL